MDLLQYAARACPPLDLERINSHKPKAPSAATPLAVISASTRRGTMDIPSSSAEPH